LRKIRKILSPKQIARLYAAGQLTPADRPKSGLMLHWIDECEHGKGVARITAITHLARLADLEHGGADEDLKVELNVIPIAIDKGKIVPIKSA
jgi:hypothetical protein